MAKIVLFKNKRTSEIALNIALVVIGIMFCFSNQLGERVLSTIFGLALIILGFTMLVITIVNEQSVLNTTAVLSLFVIALGVLCIVQNIAGWVFALVPYILITLGAGFIIDAFLGEFLREDEVLAVFILKMVLGLALVVFGVLVITVSEVARLVGIIFGVSLILYGIYNFIYIASNKKKSN